MTEPGDEIVAGTGGSDRLRAGHADRVQVIGTLKAAFMYGRLTEDEYDERVGQASAVRTHAELAALTADLPAGRAAARPPTAKDVRIGVLVIIVAASVLGVILLWSPDNMLAFVTALMAVATVIVASPITVGLMVDARHHRRSGGQLLPRPPRSPDG
jgi:acyl carrier protein phosphodiesterase